MTNRIMELVRVGDIGDDHYLTKRGIKYMVDQFGLSEVETPVTHRFKSDSVLGWVLGLKIIDDGEAVEAAVDLIDIGDKFVEAGCELVVGGEIIGYEASDVRQKINVTKLKLIEIALTMDKIGGKNNPKEVTGRDNPFENAARGRDVCGINHDELIESSEVVVKLRAEVKKFRDALYNLLGYVHAASDFERLHSGDVIEQAQNVLMGKQ